MKSRNYLVSVPLTLCTNQYAFSYGSHGWHYWRDLVIQFREDPDNSIEQMRYYKFFQRCQTSSYTCLMSFHDENLRANLPRLPFGSYPWGNFDSQFSPDTDRFDDTSKDRSNQNYMWFETGSTVDKVLRKEFEVTVRLLKSIVRIGYRPKITSRNSPFPVCTILKERSGDVRFVQMSGAHRLAVLSALGHTRAVVQFDLDRYPPILEEEVENWPYVRNGLISKSAALRFFNLYFSLNGTERASALGCI